MVEKFDFLTENGLLIMEAIEKHCRERLKVADIDKYELAMLANSFDTYSRMAKYCLDNGVSNKHDQIRPEYSVMRNEYQNIIKHSGKFGLNPADRAKFFKGMDDKKAKKGFSLDSPLKKVG